MRCGHRIAYTLILYLAAVLAVFTARPRSTFREDGGLREFGTGKHKTLLGLGVVVVLCAVVSTFAVAAADLHAQRGRAINMLVKS